MAPPADDDGNTDDGNTDDGSDTDDTDDRSDARPGDDDTPADREPTSTGDDRGGLARTGGEQPFGAALIASVLIIGSIALTTRRLRRAH